MAQRIQQPFLHYAIPNFMKEKQYNRLTEIYSKLKFVEKQSDLFHFFQTNELNQQESLSFFKEELNREMSKLVSLQNSWYNIFASFYFEGDYLLCHDDVVEDRKFAFSYYLEDHPSSQLVLYDSTATKIVKKISVVKNLLVIFEVSNISYHEVAYSTKNGRKAVTGWLNIKGMGDSRPVKKTEGFKPHLPMNVLKYPLEQNLQEQEYYQFPQIQYCFESTNQQIEGPFYERKLTRLQLENTVVFDLQGYELKSADFYKFSEGDYILLNDPINTINLPKEHTLDVFIIHLPEGVIDSQQNLIQIVDENGEVGGIPYINNTVFMVHRKQKNYYVDRVKHPFFLGHLIYQRKVEQTVVKTVKNTNSKAHIKSIRQKLINHFNQERDQAQVKTIPHDSSKTKQIIKQKKGGKKTQKKK